ncbi:MliC family protein [Leptospira wolbachii]|uniref:MliC family protein n=1 Tax=Leptospira wolbachii TaxID=29511 RepID=UPI0002DD4338|nr:MliC family protein [Leptospira wolbachii]
MKTYFHSKFISHITIIATVCLTSFLCSPTYEEIKVVYQDSNGQKVTAVYHNPSDGKDTYSVTLKIPNRQPIILKQGFAASGVRYTDDKTLVWWTKGGEAFMMELDGKGDWEITNKYKEI